MPAPTTHPVEVDYATPTAEPVHDLTTRTVGRNAPTVVLRHGDRDVIRAAARPYYVVEVWRAPEGPTFRKVSWHHDLAAARARFDRERRRDPVGRQLVRGLAIVKGRP